MEYVNKNPLIICVCGKARSGKSTVSNYLYDMFTNNGLKVIFSPYTKYLKQYIYEITGEVVSESNKPRHLLQKLSSDLIKGRLQNKDFFIRRQVEDIDFYSYFFDVIIINDVRFPNEISVLKDKFNNVLSIGVNRDDIVSDLSYEQKNDITETSLDNYDSYDYVIYNNLDTNLEENVLNIYNSIRGD